MTEQEVFDLAMRKAFGSETGDETGATPGTGHHPADRGGLTQYGLTLAFLRSHGLEGDLDGDGDVDVQDVLAAKPADARRLFRKSFWIGSGAADFAVIAPELACEHFDFAVVAGPGTAVRTLQRALCDLGFDVVVDGGYGEETHRALRRVLGLDLPGVPIHAVSLGAALLQAVRRRQAAHFVRIVEHDRSQIAFLLGWIRRALDLDS